MITMLLVIYLAGAGVLGILTFILMCGFPSQAGDGWLAVKMLLYAATWPVSIPLALVYDRVLGR